MAKIRTLRRCQLFQGLSYRDLAILAAHVQEESIGAGKWIAQEGEASSGLVIIKTGKVEITSNKSGTEKIVLGPDEFFGELAIVNGSQPRAIQAKSVDKCDYLRISPFAYRKLMSEAPEVAGKIAQGVLEQVSHKMTSALTGILSAAESRKET